MFTFLLHNTFPHSSDRATKINLADKFCLYQAPSILTTSAILPSCLLAYLCTFNGAVPTGQRSIKFDTVHCKIRPETQILLKSGTLMETYVRVRFIISGDLKSSLKRSFL